MTWISLSRTGWIRLATAAGIVGIIGLAALAVHRDGLPVTVERVRAGTVRAKIAVSGIIEPATAVSVAASLTGRVVEIPAQEGQSVREGDILLRLDPAKAGAAVRRSEAELASAEADVRATLATMTLSEEKAARMEQLSIKRLISVEELQNARNETQIGAARYASARERVEQSRAALDAAQEDAALTIIRAPMTGVVVQIAVETGEVVTGSTYGTGATLLRLADLSAMVVRASVDETDIAAIRIDQPVEVRVEALPDTLLTGRVIRMARAAGAAGREGEPVTFPVDILLSRLPAQLRPGMSAQGHIVTETRDGVIAVPLYALQENREGAYVYTLDHTLIRRTPVTPGLSDDMQVEIKDGLEAGSVIVTGSARMLRVLKDGDKVSPTYNRPVPQVSLR